MNGNDTHPSTLRGYTAASRPQLGAERREPRTARGPYERRYDLRHGYEEKDSDHSGVQAVRPSPGTEE